MNSRKQLISSIRRKKFTHPVGATIPDLQMYLYFINKKRPYLQLLAKKYNIKGRSRATKKDLVNKLYKFVKNTEKKYRDVRIVNSFIQEVTQKTIVEHLHTIDDIDNNGHAKYFDEEYNFFVNKGLTALFKRCKGVLSANVKFSAIVEDGEDVNGVMRYKIRYEKNSHYVDRDNIGDILIPKFESTDSNLNFRIIGYKILFFNETGEMEPHCIRSLKAYHPSNNRKYHEMTVASTSNSGLCIYETWRHIMGIKSLKYSHRNNKKYREELKNALHSEGHDIEKNVKDGNLVISLELLTKKYNTETLIVFYGSNVTADKKNKMISFDGEKPLLIKNGVTDTKFNDYIYNFDNKQVYLYEKDKHVAPFEFKIKSNTKMINTKKNLGKNKYIMRPINLKKSYRPVSGVMGFDTETYGSKATLYCICVYGTLNNELKSISFYGKKCLSTFVDWIDNISTPKYDKKAKAKKSIPQIYIFGYNNSNFDNLLIYKELNKKNPSTKYCFANNSIKYMYYNNISFHDIALFYRIAGGLRNTAKEFELEEEKGVFPYDFVNKNNLEYVGEIPDKKYWNSEEDYKEYVSKHDNFNMKKYTIKYCTLDAKIVYQLAKKHYQCCQGEINGKKYYVFNSPTAANMSLKLYKQVFLDKNIKQSPDNIIECERNAYKGGRTEVFKKYFKGSTDKPLYYVDINSAHPSGMTELMPHIYLKTEKYDKERKITKWKTILPTDLFFAKVKYVGTDKCFIPNILTRHEKSIIALKETNYSYQWGCELIEAIKNGCEVYVTERIIYSRKKVFDGFSNYFYNERLKIKKTNKAKSMFYKTILNSLYGKFGQKNFNHTKLINYHELNKFFNNDLRMLVNWRNIDKNTMLVEYTEKNDEYKSIGQLVRFSSYIAATTRCKLSMIMRDVGHKNVYYCDTDSIFTTKKPDPRLINQTKLGKWSYECEPIIEATFIAPKVYTYKTLKNKIDNKAKGIKANNIDSNDYNKLQNGEIESIKQNSKMFFRDLDKGIEIKDVERSLKPIYNKRIWYENDSEAYKNLESWRNKE